MKDHYSVLGVSPEASTREIKSAFRKKAKSYHPDAGRDDSAAMRALLEAYRVLSDPQSRRQYDRGRLRILSPSGDGEFDYRAWLRERLDDPEYVAKLVFYDLLHNLEDEALEMYERIRSRDDGRLERFFERPEAMDAEFCIAEEYAHRGRLDDAFTVLVRLITMEQKLPGFGYFYDVVLSRFRHLVLDEMPRVVEPERMVEVLDSALSLCSSTDNDAQFYRRKAEILHRLGRDPEAAFAYSRAIELEPGLPGLKALARKVGVAVS